ncbi:MAG: hypothetical protein ABL958_02925, partial [Bdellovibrionia bacterium]
SIENLNLFSISMSPTIAGDNMTSLFTVVRKPFHNVQLRNVRVAGWFGAATVAAVNYSRIHDVYVSGSVNATWMGGIVLFNHGEIRSVTATIEITSQKVILVEGFRGGIAGKNSGVISDSSFYGSIEGGSEIGGIAGINLGLINVSYAGYRLLKGDSVIGGIAGRNHKDGRIHGGRVGQGLIQVGRDGFGGGVTGSNAGIIERTEVAGTICGSNFVRDITGEATTGSIVSATKAKNTVLPSCD